MAITQEEREFFITLGSRIAALRKEAHLTQVHLALALGVAQSTLNAYEVGQPRVPVSALPGARNGAQREPGTWSPITPPNYVPITQNVPNYADRIRRKRVLQYQAYFQALESAFP